jgi:hypothetical protein
MRVIIVPFRPGYGENEDAVKGHGMGKEVWYNSARGVCD